MLAEDPLLGLPAGEELAGGGACCTDWASLTAALVASATSKIAAWNICGSKVPDIVPLNCHLELSSRSHKPENCKSTGAFKPFSQARKL